MKDYEGYKSVVQYGYQSNIDSSLKVFIYFFLNRISCLPYGVRASKLVKTISYSIGLITDNYVVLCMIENQN